MTQTLSPASRSQLSSEVDNFIGTWLIGGGMPGAPSLRVNLMFDLENHTVAGSGTFGWMVGPPMGVSMRLIGEYRECTRVGQQDHQQDGQQDRSFAINILGYDRVPPVTVPLPMNLANLHLFMILNHDLEEGEATYDVSPRGSQCLLFKDEPVKRIEEGSAGRR